MGWSNWTRMDLDSLCMQTGDNCSSICCGDQTWSQWRDTDDSCSWLTSCLSTREHTSPLWHATLAAPLNRSKYYQLFKQFTTKGKWLNYLKRVCVFHSTIRNTSSAFKLKCHHAVIYAMQKTQTNILSMASSSGEITRMNTNFRGSTQISCRMNDFEGDCLCLLKRHYLYWLPNSVTVELYRRSFLAAATRLDSNPNAKCIFLRALQFSYILIFLLILSCKTTVYKNENIFFIINIFQLFYSTAASVFYTNSPTVGTIKFFSSSLLPNTILNLNRMITSDNNIGKA